MRLAIKELPGVTAVGSFTRNPALLPNIWPSRSLGAAARADLFFESIPTPSWIKP